MKPKGILKYKFGKPYALGMLYEETGAKAFKKNMVKLIKQEIKKQDFKPQKKYSFVNLYWTWFFPSTKNDTNNRYKCAIDAVSEFGKAFADLEIWTDDNVSMNKDVKIYYDSLNPRVEIELKYAPDIGIFNDKEDYNNFINTYCNNCKKGNKIGQKGGCSVFRDAMESRIKEAIPMNTEEERQNKVCLNIKNKV